MSDKPDELRGLLVPELPDSVRQTIKKALREAGKVSCMGTDQKQAGALGGLLGVPGKMYQIPYIQNAVNEPAQSISPRELAIQAITVRALQSLDDPNRDRMERLKRVLMLVHFFDTGEWKDIGDDQLEVMIRTEEAFTKEDRRREEREALAKQQLHEAWMKSQMQAMSGGVYTQQEINNMAAAGGLPSSGGAGLPAPPLSNDEVLRLARMGPTQRKSWIDRWFGKP